MSKSTTAVILTSNARLHPWGDDGWRFSGAMQLVHDGPDWLHAQWPTLDGGSTPQPAAEFASLTLRESSPARAADIAVMAFALLGVDEWPLLHPWWDDRNDRDKLLYVLEAIAKQYAGEFKLAVVETRLGSVPDVVVEELRALGFQVGRFGPIELVTE